jgi:hypothetical protein
LLFDREAMVVAANAAGIAILGEAIQNVQR